ncbi:TonB-dependent receptor [Microbulbifer sp.]|uniref:TonB-dependent receptor n=1 Tax=Microbulbifer sp. TaxID=1908541 RepID=UPI003F39C5AD
MFLSTIRCRARIASLAAATTLCAGAATAQEIQEEVVVIGVTPTQGAGLPETQIPYNVQSAHGDDIERTQSLSIADFLNRTMESVSINDAQNNPLQPDVQYRGFTASPLLGLAQGMAVYQNGVRINEPLGDAVNWDLVPQSAIHGINLIGGSNPLFGLNTLGGALSLEMKNGFDSEGHNLQLQGGSFGRRIVTAESGGNRDGWGYYANVSYFDEDGWRDASPTEALNLYGSLGWQDDDSSVSINAQYGDSDLTGNGAVPVELLARDRSAIFTAPDITKNEMTMVSLDAAHSFTDKINFTGNVFYRRNKTQSFNGDASEFAICDVGGRALLIEGLEDDDLEELGLDDDDVCDNSFASVDDIETFLDDMALAAGEDAGFNIEDLSDELAGTGILSDQAINNQSDRTQESYGTDLQLAFTHDLFARKNQFITGIAWFHGDSRFKSVLELANLDPATRSTEGLGTGTFVEEGATHIDTTGESYSAYFTDTIALTPKLALTVSGRFNSTDVKLRDRSGERPELNGDHVFERFNPAVGLTYSHSNELNIYGGYSESSRAPTPVELACNEHVYELAVANAIADGEDPDDVEFECRLPNAFLADPPLDQVVAKSFEVGVRGTLRTAHYHFGFFHTDNHDDILFQTTGRATGLFANVERTRRAGFESGFNGNWGRLDWYLAYSWLQATFEDNFQVLSPNHPFADGEGTIRVRAGDYIPGVPDYEFKLGGDYAVTEAFSVGLDMIYNSDQYLRGDESNQLDTLDGYSVVNLRGRYRFNRHFELYATINNLFDTDYENFGLLGEDPSEVEVPEFANFSVPHFVGPGAPVSAFVGIKVSL